MKNILAVVIAFIGIIVLVLLTAERQSVVYDCRDAHWHPDVPIEVKKECRKLMQKYYRQQEEENSRKRLISI